MTSTYGYDFCLLQLLQIPSNCRGSKCQIVLVLREPAEAEISACSRSRYTQIFFVQNDRRRFPLTPRSLFVTLADGHAPQIKDQT